MRTEEVEIAASRAWLSSEWERLILCSRLCECIHALTPKPYTLALKAEDRLDEKAWKI